MENNKQLYVDDNLNDISYVWSDIGHKPNSVFYRESFDAKIFMEVIKQLKVNEITNSEILGDTSSIKYLVKLTDSSISGTFISFILYTHEGTSTINDIIFYYSASDIHIVNECYSLLTPAIIKEDEAPITDDIKQLVYNTQDGTFDVIYVNKPRYIDDMSSLYNKDTNLTISNIIDAINGPTSSINILNGMHNSNKHIILSNIINKVEVDIILIPYNLIEIFFTHVSLTNNISMNPNTLYIVEDIDALLTSSYSTGFLQLYNNILYDNVFNIVFTSSLDKTSPHQLAKHLPYIEIPNINMKRKVTKKDEELIKGWKQPSGEPYF